MLSRIRIIPCGGGYGTVRTPGSRAVVYIALVVSIQYTVVITIAIITLAVIAAIPLLS